MDTYTQADACDAEWLGTLKADTAATQSAYDVACREAAADAEELRREGVGRDVSEARANRAYGEEPY